MLDNITTAANRGRTNLLGWQLPLRTCVTSSPPMASGYDNYRFRGIRPRLSRKQARDRDCGELLWRASADHRRFVDPQREQVRTNPPSVPTVHSLGRTLRAPASQRQVRAEQQAAALPPGLITWAHGGKILMEHYQHRRSPYSVVKIPWCYFPPPAGQ